MSSRTMVVAAMLLATVPARADLSGILPHLERYCLDCHDEDIRKGDLDLYAHLSQDSFDATLVFENLATGKMPPADVDAPAEAEGSKES